MSVDNAPRTHTTTTIVVQPSFDTKDTVNAQLLTYFIDLVETPPLYSSSSTHLSESIAHNIMSDEEYYEDSYDDGGRSGSGYEASDRGSYRSDSHHSESDKSDSDGGNGSGSDKDAEGGGGGFMQAAAGGLMGGAAGGWLSNKMAKMKLNKDKKKEQEQGGYVGYGGQEQGYSGGYGGQQQGYDQRDMYGNMPPPSGPPQGYQPSYVLPP